MTRLFRFWPLVLLASLAVAIIRSGPIVDLEITKTQFDLRSIDTALTIYKAKHGHLPSEGEGLGVLTGPGEPLAHVAGDPWLNAYQYRHASGTDTYLIYSLGRNHIDEGGAGDDIIIGDKYYQCVDYGLNCPPAPGKIASTIALAVAALSACVGAIRIGTAVARRVRRPNQRLERP